MIYQPTIDATAWSLLATPTPVRGSHIVVLTHAQPGAGRLGGLLTGHPSLACTAGAGVLELCEQATTTWRSAERTGSSLSTLAAASVRALAGSLIAVIKSHDARERWCEISAASTRSARTFLRIYPETKIICLHRDCADVVPALMRGDRGDRGGADGVAAEVAAARWRERTEELLALERDHQGQCLRIRYEDVVTSQAAAAGLLCFLGLARRPDLNWPDLDWSDLDCQHTGAGLLAGQIGQPLLDQVNRLQAELRYPDLGRIRAGG